MQTPVLSIIVPTYNSELTIRVCLESIKNQTFRLFEVIIVDDGSDDGSSEFVENFAKENKSLRLIKGEHSGKAGAVTKGMLTAVGEIRLFTDMDQATPIEEIVHLLPFSDKFDIVIGSRSGQRKGAPWTRLLMARGMMILRSTIVGIGDIKDTQCGFKLFNEKASDDLFASISKIHHGFKKISGSSVSAGFDVELLYIAEKKGYKIKEVPVSWLYVETRRVSPIKDSIDALSDLFKIKANSITGKYSNL